MKGKMTFQLITEGEVEFDILDEYVDNFEDLKDFIWSNYIDTGKYKLLTETLDDKGTIITTQDGEVHYF